MEESAGDPESDEAPSVPTATVPAPILRVDPGRAGREAERAADAALAERAWRRRLLRLLLAWMGWYLLGTLLVLGSLGVSGSERGDLLFWLGLTVGNVGALLTLMGFAVAATERGDL